MSSKSLHLKPVVSGSFVPYACNADFISAVQAQHGAINKKNGHPEPKIYYFNDQREVCAIWNIIDRVGHVVQQPMCTN